MAPAATLAVAYGGVGGTLSYATGPLAGQAIASPAALNGNGLLTNSLQLDTKVNSLDNAVNDIRASRVWEVGPGNLTTTVGFYKSSQDYSTYLSFLNVLASVAGDGETTLSVGKAD